MCLITFQKADGNAFGSSAAQQCFFTLGTPAQVEACLKDMENTLEMAQDVLHLGHLLSVETHLRAAKGNTKSREVAGALAGTAPSSTARNSVTRPEILWKAGRAT